MKGNEAISSSQDFLFIFDGLSFESPSVFTILSLSSWTIIDLECRRNFPFKKSALHV
jgi:hypothetical protein